MLLDAIWKDRTFSLLIGLLKRIWVNCGLLGNISLAKKIISRLSYFIFPNLVFVESKDETKKGQFSCTLFSNWKKFALAYEWLTILIL